MMFKRNASVLQVLACGAIALVGVYAHGQDQPTLDDLLDLTPTPEQREGSDQLPDTSRDQPAPVELDANVQRLLTGEQAADAFEQAVAAMDDVSLRLGRDLDAGLDTQREQEQILAKLDQVIAAAREQQSSSSGSSSGSSSSSSSARQQDAGSGTPSGSMTPGQQGQAQGQPAGNQAAGEHAGDASPGQVGEVRPGEGPLEELRKEWGSLPPRLRDEISEGLQERFSPVYRSLTEQYYKRLAEEQQ